jgi:Tol biopolymer transport system component
VTVYRFFADRSGEEPVHSHNRQYIPEPSEGGVMVDSGPSGRASHAFDVERYLNIRSAYGASFAPDGTLAFLMDTTGVPQVWTLDAPGAWPEQRTFYDERVTFVSSSPEREELAFGMDECGNEREGIFRLDPADGEVTPLTATPETKHSWGGWSHDGERFAFASNRRDESVFDVYVQGRDEAGDDARRVYEGEGWLSVGGWSPDDSRLVVSRAHWSFDQDLYVLDVASGDLTHVTPHEGDVRFTSAQWGPDGDALYLVTDYEADTEYLARLDLDAAADLGGPSGAGDGTDSTTGGDVGAALDVVREGGDWNVDGVALDDETGRLVYSRNVDGYTELTLGDLAGPTEIEFLPPAVVFDFGDCGTSIHHCAVDIIRSQSRSFSSESHVSDFILKIVLIECIIETAVCIALAELNRDRNEVASI